MNARAALLVCLVGCSGPASASFTLVDPHEPASLLSAWGTSASDVWVVGGRPDLTAGPTVLHFDGDAWHRVDTGQPGIDLWWVFGVGGDVFFGGSSGTILRYRDGAFEKLAAPVSNGIVFGMWGPTPQDVWAVGRLDATNVGMLLWHFDGTSWTPVDLPNGFPVGLLGFKVHGQRTDDVWISCSGGMTLHWNGTALESAATGVVSSLFSIVTTPTGAITAGGLDPMSGNGALAENAGSGWQNAALQLPSAWRGLAASPTMSDIYVVGANGQIAKRDDTGAWAKIEQSLTQLSFHADWIDPDGGFWGVGGEFDQTPLTKNGFVMYLGNASIPSIPSPPEN